MPPPDRNTRAGFDAIWYGSAEKDGCPAVRGPVKVNYIRWKGRALAERLASFYASVTTPADKIVGVGCGYGWSLEVLVDDYGYDPALLTGIDTSPHVQGSKGDTEEADIRAAITAKGLDPDDPAHVHPVTGEVGRGKVLFERLYTDTRPRASVRVLDETLADAASRTRVRQAVGGGVDFVFTERQLRYRGDGVVQTIDTRLNALVDNVYHIVMDDRVLPSGSTRLRPSFKARWEWNVKTLEEWAALLPSSYIVSSFDWRVIAPTV